jgi:hypothetical protein
MKANDRPGKNGKNSGFTIISMPIMATAGAISLSHFVSIPLNFHNNRGAFSSFMLILI